MSPARFLTQAMKIGEQLICEAIWDGERCTWGGAATSVIDGAPTATWATAGASLYDGTSGGAIFLARLFAITGREEYRRTAIGAITQALALAEDFAPPSLLGFFTGACGVAVAAETLGRLCDAPSVTASAEALATRIANSDPSVAGNDIISGLAGAVAPLLYLASRLGRDDLTPRAIAAGDLLLARAQRQPIGWCWAPDSDGRYPPLLGYSHGTAGIATAFLELYAFTRDEKYSHAARAAFEFERRHFDIGRRNWPDLRAAPGPASYPVFWCHGAGGVAASRLRALRLAPDATIQAELEIAVETIRFALSAYVDSESVDPDASYCLCHGAAGNADVLAEAGRLLGRADLLREAEAIGDAGIRARATDIRWMCGVPQGGEAPGLMVGLAGIGHFFLRLFAPESVPSALLFEPARGL